MHLIINYVRPYFKKMFIGLFIKTIGTVIELFLPYILAYIIDDITPTGDISKVLLWGFIMLICALLGWLFNVIANRNASAVARDSVRWLRHDLFEKIMYLTNRQVDWFSIPSLISRMTTDTYNIHRMIGMVQRMGVRAPILLLGGLAVTLTLDPALAGVLAATLPVMTLLIIYISRKSLPMFDAIQRAMDDLVRVVRENASGVRVIKALSRTEYEKQRFSGVNASVVKAETRANMTMGISRPVMNLLLNIGLVLVIIVGALRVNNGYMKVGVITAFLSYFTIMLNAVLGINRILMMSQSSFASANRIQEVLNSKGELDPVHLGTESTDYHIEMRNVSFSYTGKENSLNNISFALKRGESLGIIGPTGAGKSTIASLLLRFYDVNRGEILVNGANIRAMTHSDLRRKFGVVFQNDAVFRETIENNIKLNRQISMEDVDRAIKTAQASAYIEEAGGLSHDVDARGVNLSGGQKQRLLIARALAGRPEFLILDDSSSALDYKTDAELRKGIREGYGETTTIIIAQRISSIKHCDKIMVLEEGDIMGYGSHDELMQSCTLYKEIFDIQMGES